MKPIKQPPRRVPLAFAEAEKECITQLEKQRVIRKSTSPWASPIVLVRKKNGKVRPCVDYRRLNAVTEPDAFPLPRIQDCLDSVAGSAIFSTFDLISGYQQIPMKESDIPKTAFVTKYGLYEFLTMPFGLMNAGARFQRLMEIVLQGLQWQSCLVYLDDIIEFSKDFPQHIEGIRQVLDKIQGAGLKLKPEKCHLFCPKATFLGHIVSEEGIQPNGENIRKILEWPTPQNVTEVRQILGLGSYYRRFVPNFAEIMRPLIDLTKKNKEFIWSESCEQTFKKLKQILTEPDILAYPLNDDGQFILDTDASDYAIGAVLSQVQNGREKVIFYGSRALNKSERNYCITDKELLALKNFIEYYRQYLLRRKFKVRTDHRALIWLFRTKKWNSEMDRGLVRL